MNYFKNFIRKKNRKIKDLLIDQKFVSGIGNIYANEILFLSKINPNKIIKLLKKDECGRIILSSKTVLLKAIKKGGSSIRDFKNTEGAKGSFQDRISKFIKEKVLTAKEQLCNGMIIKKIIANRSTFFCNICQK